jgi:hypothetical protein
VTGFAILASLQPANALVRSRHERREVGLPLDADTHRAFLDQQVAAAHGTLKT